MDDSKWQAFAEAAVRLFGEPGNPELATHALAAIEETAGEALPTDANVAESYIGYLVKVGYLIADNFHQAFLPFGWPPLVTSVLLVLFEDDTEIRRRLSEMAVEIGHEPWELAPIFGRAIDMPDLSSPLAQRLWSRAIMRHDQALQWHEFNEPGSRMAMIHPFGGLAQVAFTATAMFNNPGK